MMECNPMYMESVIDQQCDDLPHPNDIMKQSDFDAMHDENADRYTCGKATKDEYQQIKSVICHMEAMATTCEADCTAPAPTWGVFWMMCDRVEAKQSLEKITFFKYYGCRCAECGAPFQAEVVGWRKPVKGSDFWSGLTFNTDLCRRCRERS